MESILLGFCLVSFTLSSIIVGIELARDRRRHKYNHKQRKALGHPKEASSSIKDTPHPEKIRFQTAPQTAPQKTNVLASLNKQLNALGYTSHTQQLGFINRVLNSQRTDLVDIDANEVRHLFKVIRRYTSPNVAAANPKAVQRSLQQVVSHI
ncbi:MAG: hypothetical protein HQM14_01145 [SAR324 cluster bacterium]|nr:hypothetical protein [SAR324 cluster bacterium]